MTSVFDSKLILLITGTLLSSSSAFALSLTQDQGVLNIRYEKLSKPFEYRITEPPKGCPADSVKIESVADKIKVKHSKPCALGATVELVVKEGTELSASLAAGSASLRDFNHFKDRLGEVLVDVEIGTAKIGSHLEFKLIRDNYMGRAYQRSGDSKKPSVSIKVKNGVATVL